PIGTAAASAALIVAATAATATPTAGRCARNVRPAVHANSRALVLAEHRANTPHHLLLRDIALFERGHRDVEVGVAGADELLHATQVRKRQDLLFDRLGEFFSARVTCASRQPHVYRELALIIVRH